MFPSLHACGTRPAIALGCCFCLAADCCCLVCLELAACGFAIDDGALCLAWLLLRTDSCPGRSSCEELLLSYYSQQLSHAHDKPWLPKQLLLHDTELKKSLLAQWRAADLLQQSQQ